MVNQQMTFVYRVGIVSKKFEAVADEREKWYGTHYKLEDLSKEVMDKWSNSVPSNELQLPAKNEFIPSNFKLFSKDENVIFCYTSNLVYLILQFLGCESPDDCVRKCSCPSLVQARRRIFAAQGEPHF